MGRNYDHDLLRRIPCSLILAMNTDKTKNLVPMSRMFRGICTNAAGVKNLASLERIGLIYSVKPTRSRYYYLTKKGYLVRSLIEDLIKF